MKALTIPVTYMSMAAPIGPVISAMEFNYYLEAQDIIEDAYEQAENILNDAQNEADNLQEECDEMREAARQEGIREFESEAQHIRQKIVADTIEWVVAEYEVERYVIERLEGRMRGIMVQVFEEFYGQQQCSGLLITRLREAMDQLVDDEKGILRVSHVQFDELSRAFVAYPQLRLECDQQLATGKAILTTPMVYIHLDLDEQLQSIISRLNKFNGDTDD
jgi:flagellar biosynthesis/type III secretory pathway protein FliH